LKLVSWLRLRFRLFCLAWQISWPFHNANFTLLFLFNIKGHYLFTHFRFLCKHTTPDILSNHCIIPYISVVLKETLLCCQVAYCNNLSNWRYMCLVFLTFNLIHFASSFLNTNVENLTFTVPRTWLKRISVSHYFPPKTSYSSSLSA
jgi:hypothetical protein